MTIDLMHDLPFILADTATTDELWKAVAATELWTQRAAEVLDYVYRVRVAMLLRTQTPPDSLRCWIEHLQQVAQSRLPEQLESLNKSYASRWLALRDLLVERSDHYPAPPLPADQSLPATLWKTVQDTSDWTQEAAATMDQAYRTGLIVLLCSKTVDAELARWSEHLGRVAHPLLRQALEKLEKRYISRWQLLRELLEDRLAMRRYPLPELFLERPHVQTTLQRVADGELKIKAALEQQKEHEEQDFTHSMELLERLELIRYDIVDGKEILSLSVRAADLPAGYLRAGSLAQPNNINDDQSASDTGPKAGVVISGSSGTAKSWLARRGSNDLLCGVDGAIGKIDAQERRRAAAA
ncbi:MAG: hypothetical protein HQL90_06525 [Magnetococcales bacterium]|nr:hypothetical protein [Magnetococcales bacterium]